MIAPSRSPSRYGDGDRDRDRDAVLDLPWWPCTGMTSLLLHSTDGTLYKVPDTPDTIPRDYDCALALPSDMQRQITGSGGASGWPLAPIDPKCVVVVTTPSASAAARPNVYWFVRLSLTPQVLRRVPGSIRRKMLQTLSTDPIFRDSTLLTTFSNDDDTELDPAAMGWESVEPPRLNDDDDAPVVAEGRTPMVCCVCHDRPVSRILVPCGHGVLCAQCGSEQRSWRRCPICRATVVQVRPLFT